MSNTTPTNDRNADILAMFAPPARPADWLTVDEDQLYEGPEYRHDDDDHGVRLLWTPKGILYGLAPDTDMTTLTRVELLGLRTAIDDALTAVDNLD